MRRNSLFILLGLFIIAGLAPARIAAPAYSLENGAVIEKSLLDLYHPAYINLGDTLAENGKHHITQQTRSVAALSGAQKIPLSPATASNAELVYTTYLQDSGWQPEVQEGAISGGAALPLEAVRVRLTHWAEAGSVSYRTYRQDSGWSGYAKNGEAAGVTGAGEAIEAVQFKLTVLWRLNTIFITGCKRAVSGGSTGPETVKQPERRVSAIRSKGLKSFC